MIRFETETGSQYELDEEGMRLRRLSGKHAPTANQRQDEEWREYQSIAELSIGNSPLVVWGTEITDEGPMLRRTLISPVVRVWHP
jgi:hypothetical protein